MLKVKKIIGILLVKHCLLLDPKDAVPLHRFPLNKVSFVPNNESLLGILVRIKRVIHTWLLSLVLASRKLLQSRRSPSVPSNTYNEDVRHSLVHGDVMLNVRN
ncbi:hypothetical protein EV424DRAFT_480252 [Suillus variegatus]|nr:hypothetical protein EV424DRAFT_480252 [Suillus variegatus]